MSREKLVISSTSYNDAPTQTIDVGGTRFAKCFQAPTYQAQLSL